MQIFCNGLNYSTRALIDAVCGGSITSKISREVNQLFEELAKKTTKLLQNKIVGRNKRECMKLIGCLL